MQEALFQFIWQFSLYSPVNLKTDGGESVTIVHPGKRNSHAGPDFAEARIRIGSTLLVGNVELHIHTSDWNRHGHQTDAAYSNIILHVVYHNDGVVGNVPVLELASYIPDYVIDRYTHLLKTVQPIPCAHQLDTINPLTKESWLNRLLAERWEQKLGDWQDLLQLSAGDWRTLLYWRMAANFGFKVNAEPFLLLTRTLPLNVLARHRDSLFQLEALLFGQAGFLEKDFEEEYPQKLKAEYAFLRAKYNLAPIPVHLWKFLRMRPANFPTVRIAQFAALIHASVHLFTKLLESESVEKIKELLDVAAGNYWDNHYRFDELHIKPSPKHLGETSIQNLIINTVAPIRFLYANRQGSMAQQEQALQLLEAIPAEDNNVLRLWAQTGWKAVNAAQSQSLLQLHNRYCAEKRCLECAIGLSIIRSRP